MASPEIKLTGTKCLGELGRDARGAIAVVPVENDPGFQLDITPELEAARKAAVERRRGHELVELANAQLDAFGD